MNRNAANSLADRVFGTIANIATIGLGISVLRPGASAPRAVICVTVLWAGISLGARFGANFLSRYGIRLSRDWLLWYFPLTAPIVRYRSAQQQLRALTKLIETVPENRVIVALRDPHRREQTLKELENDLQRLAVSANH